MQLSNEDQQLVLQALRNFNHGTASPAEEKFVAAYFAITDNDSTLLPVMTGEEKRLVEEEIYHRLFASVKEEFKQLPPSPHIFKWKRYAVAASIVLFAGILTAYFITHKQAGKITVTASSQKANKVIQPASGKATLTLVNGAVLTLESSQNGIVAAEANTRIIKTTEGNIVYEHASANANLSGYNTITAPRGGYYSVTLSDGTKVWLNAASSLHYPVSFNTGTRSVTLQGEAYFEVAPDKTKPFIVQIKNIAVQVVGTHFNVNGYEGETGTAISLLEGIVRIKNNVKGDSTVKEIKAGQQAIVEDHIRVSNDVDMQEIIAWKNGYFSMKGADLSSICREISRWYDIEVVCEGNTTNKHLIGAISRDIPLTELLTALKEYEIEGTIEPHKITLKSK